MKNTTRTMQSGFTLIELIMVIVILGILSAFALPRFADLGGEAWAASIQAAAGSIRSAANIAHAQALAANLASGASVDLEGQTVTMVNFYPTADAAGILEAAQISGSVAPATTGDYALIDTDAGNAAGDEIIIQARGASTAGNCQISYTAAATNATPQVVVDVSDC